MIDHGGRVMGVVLFGALLWAGCDGDSATSPLGQTGGSGGISTASATAATATTGADGTAGDATATATTGVSGADTQDPTSGTLPTTLTMGGDSTGDATASDTEVASSSADGTDGGESSTGPGPECTEDTACAPGSICENETCVPGCTGRQPCGDGLSCCAGECIDTAASLLHCGVCDNACDMPESVDVFCDGVSCQLGECDDGTYDCDGEAGCESDVVCTCAPEDTQPCYPGPAGTEGVGICAAGTQQCNPFGTGWGACVNFQVPMAAEVCGNGEDDDCNGFDDDVADVDGDGWTVCENDCCEDEFECGDPELVNPGAFEFVGNGVDDDCDPATPDGVVAPACSNASLFGGVEPEDMAEAMELCQSTTLAEPLPTRKWGLISAEFLTADGGDPTGGHLSAMMDSATAVMTDYGTGGVGPLVGNTMAGMSSGVMRDANDLGYAGTNTNLGFSHQPPAGYLASNGGALPSAAGCSGDCPAGSGANDSVLLRLTVRVPTNAQSFRYRFRFFSSEYWDWSCSEFNDFYLAILDSGAAGLPADGNISFDSLDNPVSVNNGFFESCVASGCYTCPSGSGALAGTGMELNNTGGGTDWLVTSAPIVPGEIMTLDLTIFDVSDGNLDSLVLLDGFEWNIDPSEVGTNPQD